MDRYKSLISVSFFFLLFSPRRSQHMWLAEQIHMYWRRPKHAICIQLCIFNNKTLFFLFCFLLLACMIFNRSNYDLVLAESQKVCSRFGFPIVHNRIHASSTKSDVLTYTLTSEYTFSIMGCWYIYIFFFACHCISPFFQPASTFSSPRSHFKHNFSVLAIKDDVSQFVIVKFLFLLGGSCQRLVSLSLRLRPGGFVR